MQYSIEVYWTIVFPLDLIIIFENNAGLAKLS